jgi:hypothetical protein
VEDRAAPVREAMSVIRIPIDIRMIAEHAPKADIKYLALFAAALGGRAVPDLGKPELMFIELPTEMLVALISEAKLNGS